MSNTNIGIIEEKAFISNVQKYNMYDGPGIRTLVFFKGCPLRCKWCANPENLHFKFEVMYRRNLCKDCGTCATVCPVEIHRISKENSKHEINRSIQCIGCGKCKQACITSALSIAGEMNTISELMEIIEEDRMFYDVSGGGVTIGGGEPLMQVNAVTNLLMACKQAGINTAIETSGYAKLESLIRVSQFTDLFLFDIKHINSERHSELSGVDNVQILKNLEELLRRGYNVKVRMPLLKDINDNQRDIEAVINFLMPFLYYKNFKGIDLLPYHKLGVNKYKQLDMEYPLALTSDSSLTSEEMSRIESWIKKYDIQVMVINH